MKKRCEMCGAPLPAHAPPTARFHSTACRQAAYRDRKLNEQLRAAVAERGFSAAQADEIATAASARRRARRRDQNSDTPHSNM